jgi:hypothetical protein
MEIDLVRPEGDRGDAVSVVLAFRLAWVLWLGTIQPLALIVGIENLAADERAYPGREVVRGRDDAACGKIRRRVLPRVIVGLERSCLGRRLEIVKIGRIDQGV